MPLGQHQHLTVIRTLLTDETIPLLTRIAALLMLLYAQPLTRILKLTLDDMLDDNGELSIRLGEPPISIPEPFASLLRQHLEQRLNLTTATNRDARWLFPGRRAGQPMVATTLGYTHDHTARTATTAGITWSRYAPGDHTQLNNQRTDDN